MKIKALIYIYLAALSILLQGCLENNIIPEFHSSMDNSAEMLVYFESQGDFINTMDAPPLVTSGEVNGNPDTYLIIDLRSRDLFLAGHVKGAVNLEARDLLAFIKGNNTKYLRVVLVSRSGQASSYYATLLRLLGYSNVYSLDFGMASWNSAFSAVWDEHTKDSPYMKSFTNARFNMNEKTPLPRLEFRTKSDAVKDKVEERVNDLLSEGFNENLIFDGSSPSGPAITAEHLFPGPTASADYYTVCYGSDALYSATGVFNPFSGLGHPGGAVPYAPFSSLKSSNYLQTLPRDKKIGIYCYNGQFSASAAAYLRLLGYDAKSMLFGAHVLFYSRILYDPLLLKHAYRKDAIGEYPFVTGE